MCEFGVWLVLLEIIILGTAQNISRTVTISFTRGSALHVVMGQWCTTTLLKQHKL